MQDKKKKIIIMYDFYSEHGGVERIMSFQSKTLRKAGYDVEFAFAYVNEKLAEEKLKEFKVTEYSKLPVKNETAKIISSMVSSDLKSFEGADLIICHSFPASYTALKIKDKYKIPYILHLHHPPQFLYNVKKEWADNTLKRKTAFIGGKIFLNKFRKLDIKCVNYADDYIIECEAVHKIIKDIYNVGGTVCYPTFDKRFNIKKTENLSKYSIQKDFILGSGRIIRQKRFDYLIKAFSKLKNKDELQLVLVGKYDNKEKKYLEKLTEKLKLDNVLFLGNLEIDELIKIYNSAKLTVLTCPKEWFGIVPLESMACGTPVISWKDGMGPEETVIPNLSGAHAIPYEIDDLALNIEKVLDKKWDKNKIRASVAKFSEKEMGKVLIKKVEGLLN